MSYEFDPVVRRYLDGDEDAFRNLLESEAASVQARIDRRMAPLMRRRVSVQDVWQEVSIAAFEQRATFLGNSRDDFRRWISGIADRSVLALVSHHAETQKRGLHHEVSRSVMQQTAHARSAGPTPSQQAIGTELEAIAERALELLPPDYQKILRLYRESGASLREIAERIGRSHDATKKLHGRAMVQFTEHFDRLRKDADD